MNKLYSVIVTDRCSSLHRGEEKINDQLYRFCPLFQSSSFDFKKEKNQLFLISNNFESIFLSFFLYLYLMCEQPYETEKTKIKNK